jgi:hypothetical protein
MIKDITINIHAGSRRDIVEQQIAAHNDLKITIPNIDFNLRIERYPHAYPSFSQLMNHAIASSKNEWMIFLNDRTTASSKETQKIIDLLEDGFACVFLYNVGYMGFSKELIRKIGWWDERFLLGGWEDRDWVARIKRADLALYESQEACYDYSWKSPLQEIGHNCRLSQPHWDTKWNFKYTDAVIRMIPEEQYEHWNLFLGDSKPEISNSWKRWSDSILNIGFDKPNSGPSGSSFFTDKKVVDLS